MPTSRRARRAAIATTSALLTTLALAVPAIAAPSTPTSAVVRRSAVAAPTHVGRTVEGPRLSATFALRSRAPHPDALARLAATTVRTQAQHAAHVDKLRAWRPARTTAARVTGWARAHDLSVDYNDRWLVVISGTPTAMATAFDVRVARRAAPGLSRRYLTAVDRVRVPTTLRRDVTAVAGLDNRPMAQPRMVAPGRVAGPRVQTSPANGWKPDQLRSAYGIRGSGRGVTVATVQFAPLFRGAADVAAYADHTGIDLAPGQIQPVSVRGANVFCTSCGGGEGEVALDTEMILAAAPRATQRLYIASRNAQFEWPFAALARDAEAGLVQAASVSWGFCELAAVHSTGGTYYLDHILRPTIQRVVAAGATLFAASGDAGAHDCRGGLPPGDPDEDAIGVDIPAAIPEIVGVGGTALTYDDAVAHPTASDFEETAWYTPGTVGHPENESGAGGGYSAHFARPAYQALLGAPNKRHVPDISAVADPDTGVYECDAVFGGCGGGVGGTSAGAPLHAGALAATLSSAGWPLGLGDIHGALYKVVDAHPSDVRDVTVGANDTYSAEVGYDLITGLGSPIWRRLGPDIRLVAASSARTGRFHAVNPHIVLDTRHGSRLGGHGRRTLDLTDVGVPRGATAAALEIATVKASKDSALSVFAPGSRTHPANVHYAGGRPSTGEVTARLKNGRVRIRNVGGHTHVVVALDGWYAAGAASAAADSAYHALPRVRRVIDRGLDGHESRTVGLRTPGAVPRSATAVAIRLLATDQTRSGSLTVRPAGSHGHVRALYWRGDTPASNRISLRLGTRGRIVLANHGGHVKVTGIVEGYWAPVAKPDGAAYHPITPALLLDTRTGEGLGGDSGRLRAGDSLHMPLTGVNGGLGLGIPATGVTAVVLDIVGRGDAPASTLIGYPAGTSTRLPVLRWRGGEPAGVTVLAHPGRHGSYVLVNRAGRSQVRVTVEGYFTR